MSLNYFKEENGRLKKGIKFKMPDNENTKISFLKNNLAKLQAIATFLDISLEEVSILRIEKLK